MIQIEVPASSYSTNLDNDVIFVVGRIVRWWSMIEFTIDSSIRDLLSRPDIRYGDTALVLPFKQRLALLKDLLSEIVKNPEQLAKLKAIVDRIASLQNYRDLIVHGMMVRDPKRPQTHIYLSRVRWSWPTKVRRTFL